MKYENFERTSQLVSDIRYLEQQLEAFKADTPIVRIYVGGRTIFPEDHSKDRVEALLEGIKTDLTNKIANLKRELEEL